MKRRTMIVLLCSITFVFTRLVLAGPTAAGELLPFAEAMQPFLKQHCYACHGPEKQESQVRYDDIEGYRVEQRNLWATVHEKLASGEMPPEDHPQPTAAERRRVLDWIEQQAAVTKQALGAGSVRRLNRRELSAALDDITGLSVPFVSALPGDGTVDGFDTGAEALQDAADSVSQSMEVARRAVDGLFFLEAPPAKIFAADFSTVKDANAAFNPWKTDGATAKLRGAVQTGVGAFLEPEWVGEGDGSSFFVPPPPEGHGILRLKLLVAVVKSDEKIPNPNLWVKVGAQDMDFVEITGTLDRPQELHYQVQVEDLAIDAKGVEVSLENKVEIPYAIEGFPNEDRTKPEDNIPGGSGLFRPTYDKKLPREKWPVPFVVLKAMEIEPNYIAPWPPAAWQADVGQVGDDAASAKRLLDLWIERAWRRPVSDTEQARFVSLYEKLRGEGMTFDYALRAAFQAVLLSGPFRYLASPADKDPAIAQHAIASRLSFMLVGAPPDAELRRLAAEGKLRDAAVLDAQVDRLMADPRSDAFVRPFVTQWLELEQPITIVMDHINKVDFRFGRYLKTSMRDETIAYIARLFSENRSAKELISSDWTMMNERLGLHYGYPEVRGGTLRPVTLRKDDPRGGGLLSHAGIQSMLCWMGDNWVIYRGAWAARHILNDPPPPPPLEVPELNPSEGSNRGKSPRELLLQHQADAKCSICHRSIDALGFAMQNFDISGRWRDVEHESYARSEIDGKIEWRGVGKTRPVDAAGELPRGEKYTDFADCKQQVIEHYLPDVVGGVLENLMIYATGRKPDVADRAELIAILENEKSRGYGLRDLVKAVIRSKAFLEH